MKKLIAIYGINGAGKTSLVKNLLMSDFVEDSEGDFLFDGFEFFEKKNKFGTYTVSKGGKIVAVGNYSTKCGGADSIKTVEDYFGMIDYLSENYPDSILCVEGVLQRAINDLITCYEKFQKKGYEEYLIKLDVSLENAIKRVENRNGRIPNKELIEAKFVNTGRLFQKLQDCEKFNCQIIDTDNKTFDEVYLEFGKIINEF